MDRNLLLRVLELHIHISLFFTDRNLLSVASKHTPAICRCDDSHQYPFLPQPFSPPAHPATDNPEQTDTLKRFGHTNHPVPQSGCRHTTQSRSHDRRKNGAHKTIHRSVKSGICDSFSSLLLKLFFFRLCRIQSRQCILGTGLLILGYRHRIEKPQYLISAAHDNTALTGSTLWI